MATYSEIILIINNSTNVIFDLLQMTKGTRFQKASFIERAVSNVAYFRNQYNIKIVNEFLEKELES